jgi:hypothetical protein
MRISALATIPVIAAAVLLPAAAASADPVGTPGTPNCFGQRVSHGSSDHGLTPGERAAALQEIVDSGDPLALELFGPTVSVAEFTWFVRVNCSDDPIIPS